MRRFCCRLFPTMIALGLSMPAQGSSEITHAQPPLPTASLTITSRDGVRHDFTVEMAKTYQQQEVGEMFRTSLAKDRGMLFLWPQPQNSDMWMRNTLVPLDIVFIDSTNHVHAIVERAIPRSEAILSSHGPVASTLELAGGVTEALGIEVGDVVSGSALARTGP